MPRFRIEPRDVPPDAAARRLGLTQARFEQTLPQLMSRGFPAPDPTTGHYDLAAIDRWCDRRHAHLFALTPPAHAAEAPVDMRERLARVR